jgi:hypothetical protein
VENLISWKKIKVNNSLFLTVHPELQTEQAVYKGNSITLLGYILDPYDPLSSDSDIINRMIRQATSADDVFSFVDSMGGRFVIVLNYESKLRIFSDAAGLRQVFYTRDSFDTLWCAAQPGMIAEQLNMKFDEEILNEFINPYFFKTIHEYWYPGDSTAFKEIIHLLPNHYLDINTGEVVRYWPTNKLDTISPEECVEESSRILKGLIEAAYHRFDLALGISAGLDSRILLAASKNFSKDIFYYSQQSPPRFIESHPDLVVPAKLLAKLGLNHKIIKCPPKMDEEFEIIFKRNVTTARPMKGLAYYCNYIWNEQGKVAMIGNCAEIGRCYFRLYNSSKVTPKNLAEFAGMQKYAFAIKHFDRWLSLVSGIEERYGINILDLFYWEQRMGNWAAMGFAEADIARETFTPYNCRYLLTTLLCVEEKYRKKPDFELYKKLIMHMWPETLQVPINPLPFKIRVERAIRKALIRMHIYDEIKNIYLKIKK